MAAIGTSLAHYNESKKPSEPANRIPMHKAEPDLTNTRLLNNSTLSPNKIKATVKTTKSATGHVVQTIREQQQRSNKSNRKRSKSCHEQQDRSGSGAHRANCTAAQEIFQPFDVNQTSTSQLGFNSRRSSNAPGSVRVVDKSAKKRPEISTVEEEKKQVGLKKRIPTNR